MGRPECQGQAPWFCSLAPRPHVLHSCEESIVLLSVSLTRSTAFQEESPEKHSTYQKPHKTQRHGHTGGGWGCHPRQAGHFQQPAWARAAGQKERCHSGGNAVSVTGPAGAAPAWRSEAACRGGPASAPVAGGARAEQERAEAWPGPRILS